MEKYVIRCALTEVRGGHRERVRGEAVGEENRKGVRGKTVTLRDSHSRQSS